MKRIAIFPAIYPKLGQVGYSVGWLLDSNYCLVWGNYKTRERANEIMKKEYPEHEIVNFKTDKECYHRYNSPNN